MAYVPVVPVVRVTNKERNEVLAAIISLFPLMFANNQLNDGKRYFNLFSYSIYLNHEIR